MAKTEFLAFRVNPERKRDIQRIADDEQRNLSQICEMLLYEGVEAYKKEGSGAMSPGAIEFYHEALHVERLHPGDEGCGRHLGSRLSVNHD